MINKFTSCPESKAILFRKSKVLHFVVCSHLRWLVCPWRLANQSSVYIGIRMRNEEMLGLSSCLEQWSPVHQYSLMTHLPVAKHKGTHHSLKYIGEIGESFSEVKDLSKNTYLCRTSKPWCLKAWEHDGPTLEEWEDRFPESKVMFCAR